MSIEDYMNEREHEQLREAISRNYEVAGITSDGVKILKAKTKPTTFTVEEAKAIAREMHEKVKAWRASGKFDK